MTELFGIFFLLFIILGLALCAFWIWMLIDCISNEPSQGNDKIIWVLVILLLQGIGALIYFFVRRPERIRQVGK
jgi:phospholipase D-like protein